MRASISLGVQQNRIGMEENGDNFSQGDVADVCHKKSDLVGKLNNHREAAKL